MANDTQVTGEREFIQKMRGYINAVSTTKERHQILKSGGMVARNKAKKSIPKAAKSHFYHYKGKKAEIKPGNLRNSLYVFREKTGNVSIGPRVLRSISNGQVLGEKPKKSSGFYAAMLYKSATNFRTKVIEPAVYSSFDKMLKAMDKAYNRIHAKWTKKYGL